MTSGRSLRSRARSAAAGALLVLLAAPGACTSVDVSFKSVTFEGAPGDRAFEVCRDVVASHYFGTTIRVDPAGGRIETDPIEETIGRKALRQQCYVQVRPVGEGRVEIAVLARMQRLLVEPDEEPPVRWVDVGSDVQVEGLLLDEISGRILALEIDARVVSTTLPRVARVR